MDLPAFRYHPNPLESGSVVASDKKCRCCRKARGYIYTGPAYGENELEEALCPWCIADGSAYKKFEVEFVDSEAFADGIPEQTMETLLTRTPGFSTFQGEAWPACCGDATAYLRPSGIAEIRRDMRESEGLVLNHIIYNMQISGGAALRMLESLNKDTGPTLLLFQCLQCGVHHFHIDPH